MKGSAKLRKHVWSVLAVMIAAFPLAAQWTPEEMLKIKNISRVNVSPDGKRLLFAVTEAVMTENKSEYLSQLWMAKADGSEVYQFTFGDKSSSNPQWSPCGRWVAFTSSRSGKNNIWLIRADGGEAERLTDVKTGVGDFLWSSDGRWISYTLGDAASEKEEKDQKAKNDARVVGRELKMNHLWVVPVAKDAQGRREPRQLTKGDFTVGGWDWSPDGKTIVFSHTPTTGADDWTRADVALIDVATGTIRDFASTSAAEDQPLYSPDGQRIAYVLSNNPPTWERSFRVVVTPPGGGAGLTLASTFDEQPNIIGWSADGKAVYFRETDGTVTRLGALPVDGQPARILNPEGDTVFGATLNISRTAFGLNVQAWDRPPEAFITPAERWSPVQVSKVNADCPKHPLGKTEVVRWKGAEGLTIEGLLTYPVGYEPGRRYPLVLVIHGGPSGVFIQTFIASRGTYPVAAFAAQGWAVLRANIRGSSGYGRAFRQANRKDWGGKDYRDLMAGVDQAIARGIADPNRLGVMGWSYGGYMTSWIITQTKRFKAASIGAPVTNLMSFTGTTDIPSFIPDYFGAEFWNDPETYRRHSAMFNVKGVTTPSLIQQGDQDLRVPIGQGYELYNALKRQGVEVEMVVYPRQPHGIQEPRLLLDAASRNIEWFRRHLK